MQLWAKMLSLLPASLRTLLFAALLLLQVGCESRGPGAESAFEALKAGGAEVASALEAFHAEKQRWPKTLSELTDTGSIKDAKAVLYPKVDVLGRQQDYLKPEAKVEWAEWIYHVPPETSHDTPLLVAPHAFKEANGQMFEKPQRFVIKVGTPPQMVNDEDVPALMELLAPR